MFSFFGDRINNQVFQSNDEFAQKKTLETMTLLEREELFRMRFSVPKADRPKEFHPVWTLSLREPPSDM